MSATVAVAAAAAAAAASAPPQQVAAGVLLRETEAHVAAATRLEGVTQDCLHRMKDGQHMLEVATKVAAKFHASLKSTCVLAEQLHDALEDVVGCGREVEGSTSELCETIAGVIGVLRNVNEMRCHWANAIEERLVSGAAAVLATWRDQTALLEQDIAREARSARKEVKRAVANVQQSEREARRSKKPQAQATLAKAVEALAVSGQALERGSRQDALAMLVTERSRFCAFAGMVQSIAECERAEANEAVRLQGPLGLLSDASQAPNAIPRSAALDREVAPLLGLDLLDRLGLVPAPSSSTSTPNITPPPSADVTLRQGKTRHARMRIDISMLPPPPPPPPGSFHSHPPPSIHFPPPPPIVPPSLPPPPASFLVPYPHAPAVAVVLPPPPPPPPVPPKPQRQLAANSGTPTANPTTSVIAAGPLPTAATTTSTTTTTAAVSSGVPPIPPLPAGHIPSLGPRGQKTSLAGSDHNLGSESEPSMATVHLVPDLPPPPRRESLLALLESTTSPAKLSTSSFLLPESDHVGEEAVDLPEDHQLQGEGQLQYDWQAQLQNRHCSGDLVAMQGDSAIALDLDVVSKKPTHVDAALLNGVSSANSTSHPAGVAATIVETRTVRAERRRKQHRHTLSGTRSPLEQAVGSSSRNSRHSIRSSSSSASSLSPPTSRRESRRSSLSKRASAILQLSNAPPAVDAGMTTTTAANTTATASIPTGNGLTARGLGSNPTAMSQSHSHLPQHDSHRHKGGPFVAFPPPPPPPAPPVQMGSSVHVHAASPGPLPSREAVVPDTKQLRSTTLPGSASPSSLTITPVPTAIPNMSGSSPRNTGTTPGAVDASARPRVQPPPLPPMPPSLKASFASSVNPVLNSSMPSTHSETAPGEPPLPPRDVPPPPRPSAFTLPLHAQALLAAMSAHSSVSPSPTTTTASSYHIYNSSSTLNQGSRYSGSGGGSGLGSQNDSPRYSPSGYPPPHGYMHPPVSSSYASYGVSAQHSSAGPRFNQTNSYAHSYSRRGSMPSGATVDYYVSPDPSPASASSARVARGPPPPLPHKPANLH